MLDHAYLVLALGCIFSYFLAKKIQSAITRKRISKASGCKPAFNIPQSERIIGYGLFKEQTRAAASHTFNETMLRRFEKFGSTWKASMMGQNFICTIDPENIKAILSTNFADFGLGGRSESLSPLLGRGIFVSDGPKWEHSRALLRPSFAKDHIADLDTFEKHIQNLISRIPQDDGTVDLQPLFFQFTLDSATDFLFGESVNSLTSNNGSEEANFATAFDYAQTVMLKRYRMGFMRKIHWNPRFWDACATVHRFTDRYVQKALETEISDNPGMEKSSEKTQKKKYVFLSELAQQTSNPTELRDEILNILLAGRDTTASLLSNTFHVLALRPDIWSNLATEVEQLEGRRPTYETLNNMNYLRCLLNESLRLYPVVPGNGRYALTGTTLLRGGGPDGLSPIYIPAGTVISYFVYSMHRQAATFGPDAHLFRPERWMEGNQRYGWGYLPFNRGPRICLGQKFALTEVGYAIVRMVQEFEGMDGRGLGEWREKMGMTMACEGGVTVGMRRRKTTGG